MIPMCSTQWGGSFESQFEVFQDYCALSRSFKRHWSPFWCQKKAKNHVLWNLQHWKLFQLVLMWFICTVQYCTHWHLSFGTKSTSLPCCIEILQAKTDEKFGQKLKMRPEVVCGLFVLNSLTFTIWYQKYTWAAR